MAATDDKTLTTSPPAVPQGAARSPSARFNESVLGKLGELLVKAVSDAAEIKVVTYTSAPGDTVTATSTDELMKTARLRAFTRASFDGDTNTCVPLKEGGGIDEDLWRVHNETVTQARADRARAIDATISALQKFVQAVR